MTMVMIMTTIMRMITPDDMIMTMVIKDNGNGYDNDNNNENDNAG